MLYPPQTTPRCCAFPSRWTDIPEKSLCFLALFLLGHDDAKVNTTYKLSSLHPGLGVRFVVNRNNTPLSNMSAANLRSSDVAKHTFTHICALSKGKSTGTLDRFNDI